MQQEVKDFSQQEEGKGFSQQEEGKGFEEEKDFPRQEVERGFLQQEVERGFLQQEVKDFLQQEEEKDFSPQVAEKDFVQEKEPVLMVAVLSLQSLHLLHHQVVEVVIALALPICYPVPPLSLAFEEGLYHPTYTVTNIIY